MSEFGGGLGPYRPPYPSTENEIGKRKIANPGFVNSSESELKTPSVLMIYAALPGHFFTFLSVGIIGRLLIQKAFYCHFRGTWWRFVGLQLVSDWWFPVPESAECHSA